MATFSTDCMDAALNVLVSATKTLHICSANPTTRTEAATTYTLGNKASPVIGAPAASGTGRKSAVSAISGGNVTGTGTATHFAIVDATRLLVGGPLSASQAVTSGNTFDLATFDLTFPNAA